MMSLKARLFSIALAVTLLVGVFLGGLTIGLSRADETASVEGVIGLDNGKPGDVDFTEFWRAWNVINDAFVNGSATTTVTAITNQEKVWGAIAGLAKSLEDPYSVFFTPEQLEIFESDISGNFEGVGMEIGIQRNILTVIAPLPNTPAAHAGIRSGDKIVQIDGQSTADMTIDQAVRLIRGTRDSVVTLVIARDDGPVLTIPITRGLIEVPTLETGALDASGTAIAGAASGPGGLRDDGIFVIKLFNFGAQSPVLFRDALSDFINSGSVKLLIDLRGNPGGFLDAAVDLSSWFLPERGTVVVREISGADKEEKLHRTRRNGIFNENLKLAILVNRGSASASEIMAGALSEYGVATIVGEQTFGKGSVQELIPIGDGGSLKLTIARWLTPQGRSISHGGLTPDIVVPTTEEDIAAGRDPQLEEAVRLLNK
ncbi:MAG: S41 family peptidase [Candidatus Vogelbacteria bacterium]|nr:S41 family peptidase [Candidatus Vogelbacteria bacterium]